MKEAAAKYGLDHGDAAASDAVQEFVHVNLVNLAAHGAELFNAHRAILFGFALMEAVALLEVVGHETTWELLEVVLECRRALHAQDTEAMRAASRRLHDCMCRLALGEEAAIAETKS